MTKARMAQEAEVRMPNRVGALAEVSKIIADKGIDILAVVAWSEGEDAVIRMVTSDHLRAMDAFRAHDLKPNESRIVITEVPHKPGMLRHITELLAKEKIDLAYLYATAADHDKSLVALASSNNDHAVVLLNG